jgi:hypothetical protein
MGYVVLTRYVILTPKPGNREKKKTYAEELYCRC